MLPARLAALHRISWWLLRHDFRGAGRLRGMAASLLAPPPSAPITLRTMQGFLVQADASTDAGVERSLYRFGTYEAGTLHVLSACLRAGDSFIDVGANLGLMALHAAACVGSAGRVLAFEPEPDIAERLASNLALNPDRRVQIVRLALGSAPGRARLSRPAGGSRGTATLLPLLDGEGAVEVPVETLDHVLAAEGVGAVRMVKMDVQGGELAALEGARGLLARPDGPILCIEHSARELPAGQAPSAVFDLVSAVNGYQAFRLARGKEIPSKLRRVGSARELPDRPENIFYFLPSQVAELQGSGLFEDR